MNTIKTLVQTELKSSTDKLQSVSLQNHIYGCFILMQEFADGSTFEFDMDAEFDTIGLQFGFLMDTKLIFKSSQEYKNAWLELLHDIAKTKDMKKVDEVEDVLLEVIKELEDDNFFMNASESGSLSHEWSRKAFLLLNPEFVKPVDKKSLLTEAKIEKSQPNKVKNVRQLSVTRRKKIVASRSKTQRHSR
jgi:hypothetical protein